MIRRDWNHPSIILWGVRINESQDNHDFYTRTNELAHELDDSRQTGGIRYLYDSELLEDVFTMNDFGFPLRPPNHPAYLNTEFVGHTYSTKRIDNVERVAEQVCATRAYTTNSAGDDQLRGRHRLVRLRLQHARQFRIGRPHLLSRRERYFPHRRSRPRDFTNRSAIPRKKWCWNPGFNWSSGDHSGAGGPGVVPICSNCERLKIYHRGRSQNRNSSRCQAISRPGASAIYGRHQQSSAESLGRS